MIDLGHENDMAARAFGRYRAAKRRAELSAADILSGLFILSGVVFWSIAFWQLLTPPAILSLATIQALVLAFVVSVAAPLLWSALLPTTPAGQLLQQSEMRTVGFIAVVAAAVYLSAVEFRLLAAWMISQPGLAANGFAPMLAIALEIAFILIPALGWARVPFHTMLDRIRQAHEIRKLELTQRAEIASIKNRIMWVETKALTSFVNLLPRDQVYVLDMIEALFGRITDRQHEIARLVGVSADLEDQYAVVQDATIGDGLRQLRDELDRRDVTVHRPPPIDVLPAAGERGARQDAIPVDPRPAPVPSPVPESPLRATVGHSEPLRYAAEYDAARERLTGVWSVAELGRVLGKPERTARDRVNAWLDAGVVARDADGKSSFYFTESEA